MLRNRGYDIKKTSALYQTRIHTVDTRFSNCKSRGLSGLQINKGQGRKADLSFVSTNVLEEIQQETKANPQGLKSVCCQINQRWGLTLSKGQLKSYLKKLGCKWRRFRKCIKMYQDPEKYYSKVNELCQLRSLEESGYLKIYYGDESRRFAAVIFA